MVRLWATALRLGWRCGTSCRRAGCRGHPRQIKWNPRATNVVALAERLDADPATRWEQPRAGKRVTLWEEALHIEGIERPLCRLLRLTERTIDAKGQLLIERKLTLDGWTPSLGARRFDAKANAYPAAACARGGQHGPLGTVATPK